MTKVIAPHWDIFSSPPEDDSTIDWNYVEIRDRATSGSTIDEKLTRFEFEMNDLDSFILNSKSYLQIKLEVSDSQTGVGNHITWTLHVNSDIETIKLGMLPTAEMAQWKCIRLVVVKVSRSIPAGAIFF